MRVTTKLLLVLSINLICSCTNFKEILESYNTVSSEFISAHTNFQSMAGEYNGAADVYQARNGRSYRSRSAWVKIDYIGDDEIDVIANIHKFGNFRVRGKAGSLVPLQQQDGNKRYTFSAIKAGNRLEATLVIESQRTRGGYELIRRAHVNAINN